MGNKNLMAAPLWVAKYGIGLARFNATGNYAGKTTIPHHQSFDVHVSDDIRVSSACFLLR